MSYLSITPLLALSLVVVAGTWLLVPADPAKERRPIQFSLRTLFYSMTIAAILTFLAVRSLQLAMFAALCIAYAILLVILLVRYDQMASSLLNRAAIWPTSSFCGS
jgi:hypothetical protein